MATMLVVALAVISVAGVRLSERHERTRLNQLRHEQAELRKELEQLKAATRESEPVVYIGNSGSYDLVLDVPSQNSKVSSTNVPVVLVSSDGAL